MTGYDQIEHASATDVGMRRQHNEDSHAVYFAGDPEQWQHRGHLFLVADGMGGHAVGELASEQAADLIPHTYHKHASDGPDLALRKAFMEANASINRRGQQNREFKGMGTTTTVLLLRPEGAWVGHVGDSRAYLIRDDKIAQLTFDHSHVWEIARKKKVDPELLQDIPSNVITRSLGPEPLVQVDVEGPYPLLPGDTFVLCSDGLSGQLTDYEMGAITSVLTPAEACRFLINLANLRGGPDNITAMIIRVGAASSPELQLEPAPVEASARKPWYRRLNWPLGVLVLGVLLSAEAVFLTAAGIYTGIWAFVLAILTLLAGLGGLALNHWKEKRHATAPLVPRRLKVYRETSFRIEADLVTKVARAEEALGQLANEHRWTVDWPAHQEHHEKAKDYSRKGDWPAALREYCRAARPFTEALQRQRFLEDGVQLMWDKT